MNWLLINWYVVVAVVSALLLGWGVGILYGTSKGYANALYELKQREAQMKWSECYKQINKEILELNKEMKNEKAEN
jgi:hypothetical protein